MKQLRIYFKNDDLTSISWCYLIDGRQQEQGNELNDAFKQCARATSDTVLLVPHYWVYETSIDISDKNAKQLLAAAAYQLEEQLAEDVDDLHFAQGNTVDQLVPFIAIKHEKMQGLLAFEKTHQLKASMIVTEMSLCQQPADGEVNVVQHDQHYLFKSSDNAQNAICHLQQIDFFTQHFKSHYPDIVISRLEQQELLCSNIDLTTAINLKQKSYSQSYAWQAMAKQLTFPIILILLIGVLVVVNQWQENQQLFQKVTEVKQQQSNVLKTALKEFSSTDNAKITLIKALQKQQSVSQQSGFIFDFYLFLNAKKMVTSVVLEKVDYRKNQLIIDVKANNLQQLDQLTVLMKNDFKVTVSQMDSSNNGSQGRFILEHQ